jgi:flagellar basal-body rod modification protein FlgD
MSQIPPTNGAAFGSQDVANATNVINEMNMDEFLKLMITELQNQDPLDPMENSEMLAQISQIREVGATDRLSDSLETMMTRQNVASATSLIGQEIEGQANDGQLARGRVERVSIVDGSPRLHVEGATSAEIEAGTGEIDPGTYRYRVVFHGLDTDGAEVSFAIDVGPVETTGTPEVDQAILLSNLPLTSDRKSIYRTDGTGTGNYYLVGQVDGNTSRYTDTRANAELPGSILGNAITAHPGGRRYTVAIENMTGVRRLPNNDG